MSFLSAYIYAKKQLPTVNEANLHSGLVDAGFGAALVTFVALMKIKAPYGKHQKSGDGYQIPNKYAWFFMELPSVLGFVATFLAGRHARERTPLILASLWLTHYCYRTFIYPQLISTNKKRMPLAIVLSGASFNSYNAYINARWLSEFGDYTDSQLHSPRLLGAIFLFAVGMVMNIHSDRTLINLRKPGDTKYYIPEKGMFHYVSSPNYLGELIEWSAFALAAWSKPALLFAVYSAANLVPRAIDTHQWYLKKFGDTYAQKKRARLLPGIY